MLISLTVGKVDAGVAVLLTEDKRLIEFPSILLPPSITSGSIVDITVSRNLSSEAASQKSFAHLQSSILQTYGLASPDPPVLRCRNATQTSIVLEWDKLNLATATFRSLSLYRNGAKAGNIPFQPGGRREVVLSTKISGLAVDTEYSFHLILRTSGGTYSSDRLSVRTHKMTDLTGITVTPGILPSQLSNSLTAAVDRIGGKMADTVRIDTTHFVCTEGRGKEWERATEMNIPVVRPEWVEGCEREGRIVGVRGYYLNADPKHRELGQGIGRAAPPPLSQQQLPQRPPPESPGRRDTAAPAPDQLERNTRVAASNAETSSHSALPLASPPPPTPAKDERIDPASSRPTATAAAAVPATVSEDAESESDGESAIAAAGGARSEDKSTNESGEVSPIEPEDKTSNALGISGISRNSRPEVHNARDDEEDDEDDEDEDGAQAKSPEDGGNFSEVQL